MNAPLSGTKTRVVGFFKGLFGKKDSEPAIVSEEVPCDYNQDLPLTGAQLRAPAPSAQPGALPSGIGPMTSPAQSIHSSSHAASAGSQPDNNLIGFTISAQGSGHVNGVVLSPNAPPVKSSTSKAIARAAAASVAHQPVPVIAVAPLVPVAEKPAATPGAKWVELPLAAVVASLPAELQGRLVKKDFANCVVTVSLEMLFPQLASGVVRIPFEVVRESAPHLFTPAQDADQALVTLPLAEVLRRVDPAQFAKSQSQVRITAEADVTSPFADKGNNANLEVKSSTPTRTISAEPVVPAPARVNFGEAGKASVPSGNVPPSVRISMPVAAKPPPTMPPGHPKAQLLPSTPRAQQTNPPSAPGEKTPVAPAKSAPIAMPRAQSPRPTTAPATALGGTPTPKINGAPMLRMVSAPTAAPVAPASTPNAAAVTPAQPASLPVGGQERLPVALKSLIEAWPEPVKQEIAGQDLLDGNVELPLDSVAAQLKEGRVAFAWSQMRSWVSPQPSEGTTCGELELELPLKVVAPLFLGRKQSGGAKAQRLTADDRIPDFFNPAGRSAASVPVTAPAATQPAPAPVAPPQPMTPEAVVKRAAALQGVAGALVALPDGLVVASKLPPGLNADSLAAFLPQIYSKFDSGLKDLGMDSLNNLHFTAGTVPWRIYRTSSVFFVAFGRAQEPLPGDWLATLAAELEKKQG